MDAGGSTGAVPGRSFIFLHAMQLTPPIAFVAFA